MTSSMITEQARTIGRELGLSIINSQPQHDGAILRFATIVAMHTTTTGGVTADVSLFGGTLYGVPVLQSAARAVKGDRVTVLLQDTVSVVTGVVARDLDPVSKDVNALRDRVDKQIATVERSTLDELNKVHGSNGQLGHIKTADWLYVWIDGSGWLPLLYAKGTAINNIVTPIANRVTDVEDRATKLEQATNDTGWRLVQLIDNYWQHDSKTPLRIRKTGSRVWLQGGIKRYDGKAYQAGWSCARLPEEYRPKQDILYGSWYFSSVFWRIYPTGGKDAGGNDVSGLIYPEASNADNPGHMVWFDVQWTVD